MIINNINLNHLKLFEAVYRTQSMTEASKELHLTQSGVSQHMKALEASLSVKLFDRIRQRLIPTRAAQTLFNHCQSGFQQIEQSLMEIKGSKKNLVGQVNMGLPFEFGNNCIMPRLCELSTKHPQLKLNIQFGYAYEMNQLLLTGDLDFAFVDAFGFDARFYTKEVYTETLVLCMLKKSLGNKKQIKEDQKLFESLQYVDYLPSEPVLRMWFKHHFPKKHINYHARVTVSSVQGIANIIFSGLGAGVLPMHHIAKMGSKAKKLYLFKGTKAPLKNAISVAYLQEKTHSHTTKVVLDSLIEKLKN